MGTRDGNGVISTGRKLVVLSATPTLDTLAYASGDSLHTTVMTFNNVNPNGAGASLSGTVRGLTIIDKDAQGIALELWLYDTAITPAAANNAHSISDADAAHCLGIISVPSANWFASALNKIGSVYTIDLPFQTADGKLYGHMVTRGTPTYTASGLVVNLLVTDD